MRRINPESFNPWKSNQEQTPEAKLKLVREAAVQLIELVNDLREEHYKTLKRADPLYERATNFLNLLEKEGMLELINEK